MFSVALDLLTRQFLEAFRAMPPADQDAMARIIHSWDHSASDSMTMEKFDQLMADAKRLQ